MMEKKICLIYNYAQHYRYSIFKLIDESFNCDFIFGDKMEDVKKFDYSLLSQFKKEVENKTFIVNPLYYQKSIVPLLYDDYTTYIFLGDIHCISTWIILFLKKFTNKKIYLWSHGWYGREGLLKGLIKKLFFRLADGTFLYGNYARELMIKEGFDKSKLFVIHNSLSYDKQLTIRNSIKKSAIYVNHFKNDLPNLIYIGRLIEVKRLDLLLSAIYILNSQSFYVNLTIIGDGELKYKLILQAEKLDLEHIWFFGACYEEEKLAELISNAELCVSPGNVGLTAMHSMVYGTPVITHNKFSFQMPEFEAIEEGITGAFFEYENAMSLAESIKLWLVSNKNRENIRQKCYEVIGKEWNPYFQLEVIKNNIK